MKRTTLALLALIAFVATAEESSLFGPSHLTTASGKRADPDSFFEAADCGECHVKQYADWKGSMHSRAHHDGIYLAFAEMAREEGGDVLYQFCSSCHAPLAVTTGEIPAKKGADLTFLTDEGVTCDVCHNVKEIREFHAGGGANASIILEEGEVRYGPLADPGENTVHTSEQVELHKSSKLCSACHTLIHPHDGLVIENTFEEWKNSPYAEAGIQCQDCHMRTPEQAAEVARTMKPLKVPGQAAEDGPERANVYRHLFVGANTNTAMTGAKEEQAAMARKRLQGAATIVAAFKGDPKPGAETEIEVAVTNVGAGHSIPTSITELRQVWIDLSVRDAAGKEIFRSGAIGANGAVDPTAVMFNAVLADKQGKVTFKPWMAHKMISERLIPAKGTERDTYRVPVPAGAKLPLTARAVLRYRSAPQEVMDELFGQGKFKIDVVDMCSHDVRHGSVAKD